MSPGSIRLMTVLFSRPVHCRSLPSLRDNAVIRIPYWKFYNLLRLKCEHILATETECNMSSLLMQCTDVVY